MMRLSAACLRFLLALLDVSFGNRGRRRRIQSPPPRKATTSPRARSWEWGAEASVSKGELRAGCCGASVGVLCDATGRCDSPIERCAAARDGVGGVGGRGGSGRCARLGTQWAGGLTNFLRRHCASGWFCGRYLGGAGVYADPAVGRELFDEERERWPCESADAKECGCLPVSRQRVLHRPQPSFVARCACNVGVDVRKSTKQQRVSLGRSPITAKSIPDRNQDPARQSSEPIQLYPGTRVARSHLLPNRPGRRAKGKRPSRASTSPRARFYLSRVHEK